MFNYKDSTPGKAKRAYRVENLNPEKGIFASMRVTNDNKYAVCLCLANKNVVTTFLREQSALNQIKKYKQLYKEIKHNL